MKSILRRVLLTLLVVATTRLGAAADQVTSLPRGTPEAAGVRSPGIQDFLRAVAASEHEFHSFMFLRHGQVIAEGWWRPYAPGLKHTLYSLSKSFTSTAVGFAVSEKRFNLDDKVVSFFPERAPDPVPPRLAALTPRHLLMMAAGQEPDPTGQLNATEDWERGFLATPLVNEPGSRFLYNSMATYMLSAMVTRKTGEKVVDYLRPRLFEPLGITNVDWETSPTGNSTGGWGLRLHTEDLAKFGQLLLDHGTWHGKQVLPAAWVELATSRQILQSPEVPTDQREHSDWLQGYGFQFWRCRHGAFRGDGAFGQYTIVLPDQDAVIAITSETKDMQGILNLVWDHLLPAIQPAALPADPAALATLRSQLESLALPVPARGPRPPVQDAVSGRTYTLAANNLNLEQVRWQFTGDQCQVTFAHRGTNYVIPFGAGSWVQTETTRPGPNLVERARNCQQGLPPFQVAAAYGWKDAHTLELTLRYVESPHREIIRAKFDDEKLTLTFTSPLVRPTPLELTGTAAP